MKLTNSEIQYAYNWLQMPLHGMQSRMRTKFLKLIRPQYESAIDKRKDILAKFADKDEKKKPILENGLYKISDENMEKAREAVGKHLDQEDEYVMGKNEKEIFKAMKAILHEMKTPLSAAEGEIYASLMDKLDAIK